MLTSKSAAHNTHVTRLPESEKNNFYLSREERALESDGWIINFANQITKENTHNILLCQVVSTNSRKKKKEKKTSNKSFLLSFPETVHFDLSLFVHEKSSIYSTFTLDLCTLHSLNKMYNSHHRFKFKFLFSFTDLRWQKKPNHISLFFHLTSLQLITR